MGTILLILLLSGAERPLSQDWSPVLALEPGREIVITTRGRLLAAPRRFLAADEATVFVLDLDHPALPAEAKRALGDMAAERPDYAALLRGEAVFSRASVRVAADGVFVGTRRVAGTAEIIQRVPRPEVLIVAITRTRGSKWGAVVGAGVGAWLGFGLAIGIATENPCGASCRDEKALIALSIGGLPVAGGLIGYHGLRRPVQTVIYRAPASD